MLSSLAFVPEGEVEDLFNVLAAEVFQYYEDDTPENIKLFVEYFHRTYVGGSGMLPRYEIARWNAYEAALSKWLKTSNSSEGWHYKLGTFGQSKNF